MGEHRNTRGNRVVTSNGRQPPDGTSNGKPRPSPQPVSGHVGRRKPPGQRPGTGQHTVTGHRRETPKGRKVPVKRHTRSNPNRVSGRKRRVPARKRYEARARAMIGPKPAKRNLWEAWQHNRKGRNSHAVGLACLGLAQVVIWLMVQSVLLAVIAGAALFAALGLVIDEITED